MFHRHLTFTVMAQDLPQAGSSCFTDAEELLAERVAAEPNTNTARNVILFVADGMGVGTNCGADPRSMNTGV